MVRTIQPKIKATLIGLAALVTSALPASADVIFKGARGPTDWQLDVRAAYARNEKGVETITETLFLKYWDGKQKGKWFFANVPYKHISSSHKESAGIGDITLGAGPRGTVGNFHFLPYGGITLPTASVNSAGTPALGNGRHDLKAGCFVTYLTKGKGFEVDGSLEYAVTGENRQKVNPPNELAAGFVVGGKLGHFRTAAGLTGFRRENGDYLLNARGTVRYIVSQKIHFEVIGDKTVQNENIPKATSVIGIMRYNF